MDIQKIQKSDIIVPYIRFPPGTLTLVIADFDGTEYLTLRCKYALKMRDSSYFSLNQTLYEKYMTVQGTIDKIGQPYPTTLGYG